jgi:hypothetical protein
LKLYNGKGLTGDARAVEAPGKELLSPGQIIASSDSILIDKAEKGFDLAGYVITKKLDMEPLTL